MTSTQRKTLTKSRTCFDAKGKNASSQMKSYFHSKKKLLLLKASPVVFTQSKEN